MLVGTMLVGWLGVPLSAELRRSRGGARPRSRARSRKGTNGVSTNKGHYISLFVFWRRDFLGTPANLLLSSQNWRAYLSKFLIFAAAPLVLPPFVRNQRSHDGARPRSCRRNKQATQQNNNYSTKQT